MVVCALLPAVLLAAASALAEDNPPIMMVGGSAAELGAAETEGLLRKSIEMIEGRHSISAEVTHCVDLFGKKFVGKGLYREQRSGPHPLVRFELKTPTGGSESYLIQVCDGKYFWNYRVLLGQPRLDRIDLKRLAKAMEKQGRAGRGGTDLADTITLAGMPGLLRSMQESFQFDSAENEVLHSMPAWKLRGRWQADKLAVLLPEQAEVIRQGSGEVDLTRLPKHIPDHLYIWLGKDDLFPYRIEYCRREKGSGESRAIVAMQLVKVSFNVPLDPKCFVFQPRKVPVADRTSEYIAKMARRAKLSNEQ